MQCFEEIYSAACVNIAGEQALSSGPMHDHRRILRLDADRMVADTTEGRGSGPATMALAVKTRWYGPRMSRPSHLKARLRLKQLIEEGIDHDFDETEAQLNTDVAPKINTVNLQALHDLVNASCRRRQEAR